MTSTLQNRIDNFIPSAVTKARELTVLLKSNYDYYRYQSPDSQEMLFKASETYDFVNLLTSPSFGGLTDDQIENSLDFFIEWLGLFKVIPAQYSLLNDLMLEQNTIVTAPSGSFATALDLANEIAARIAADIALNDRIDNLDLELPWPDDFFLNYNSTFAVVFDDDTRLHTHANKAEIDQIDGIDIANIKALTDHYASLGEPGGQHVTQQDRDRWNANAGNATTIKKQRFVADGTTGIFTVTGGQIDQINYVTVNGNVNYEGVNYTRSGNVIDFGENIDNGWVVIISYFEGISLSESVGTYDLTSPTTTDVGGLPAGTDITGMTWQQILEMILNDYLEPLFVAFGITEIPSLIEVGVALSGVKTFTWSISNSLNVQVNTIAIRDVTANVLIASALANDGAEGVDIGIIPNVAPMARSWRAEGVNTNTNPFQSANKTVQSIYPWFYGKVASGGAAPGLSRPVANQALINSGTKVVLGGSAGTISANFGSSNDDYIWFAIPSSSPSKIVWFVDDLNNGVIGGAVSPGGNLFPSPDLVVVDSPTALWTGVQYKFYISNYQSLSAALMQMRNS
jgi:hypothetical protein